MQLRTEMFQVRTRTNESQDPALRKTLVPCQVGTWEKGSSSELGKSYWLRSLALKTAGP